MCFLVLQMFFRSYNTTTNENKLQKGEIQNILMYCHSVQYNVHHMANYKNRYTVQCT